jgi:glycolate dehydrogenase FAD-binding subunit
MPVTSTNLGDRLASIVDASRLRAEPSSLAAYAIDEVLPVAIAKPATAEEAAEIVRFAIAENLSIIPCGSRSKLAIGMPPAHYDIALDMTALHHIAHYDPGDLTLSVDTGISLAAMNSALAEHRQFVPLLLPFYSAGTVGGAIASGLDSPLRQTYGTARDYLIGAEFIDGTGAQCKSGGRVVKNVTGYDLHKLLIGSIGTLALITRLNFRTFPLPLDSRGLVAAFPTAEGALAFRRKIAESPLSPLTLDILNPQLAQIFATHTPSGPVPSIFSAGGTNPAPAASLPLPGDWFKPRSWQLCAAFAGSPEVLQRYATDLALLAQALPPALRPTDTIFLDDTTRPAIWGRLREALPLLRRVAPAATIFRVSALPETHAALLDALRQIADRSNFPHAVIARATGGIYFALLPQDTSQHLAAAAAAGAIESQDVAAFGATLTEQSAAELLAACDAVFAHCAKQSVPASILFCPAALKRQLNIFGPLRPDASAMRRLKSAFDPRNVFAPARMFQDS